MVETSEQLEQERRELLRQKALAEHTAGEAQAEIDELRERLLALETQLARARQTGDRQAGELDQMERDLAEAQRAIREMQATRVWKMGTGYWRLRDRLFRRA